MTQVHTRKFAQDRQLNFIAEYSNPLFALEIPRPWRIALKNLAHKNTLVFDLFDCVTIGRERAPGSDIPHINLQPYNAYELGVSRRHAILKLEGGHVVLIDNNSANGVLLNHEALGREIPYPVRHGDVIQLGLMSLQLSFLIDPFNH